MANSKRPSKREEIEGDLSDEAARLAGVAAALRAVAEDSGEAADVIWLMADVVDDVNRQISDLTVGVRRG